MSSRKYVQVYFNLHKKCWSVRDKKTRRVILHCDRIHLHDIRFKVSQKGRERVLREKRKNVHAFIEGYVGASMLDPERTTQVVYNPYKYDSFVTLPDEAPITSSLYCHMD